MVFAMQKSGQEQFGLQTCSIHIHDFSKQPHINQASFPKLGLIMQHENTVTLHLLYSQSLLSCHVPAPPCNQVQMLAQHPHCPELSPSVIQKYMLLNIAQKINTISYSSKFSRHKNLVKHSKFAKLLIFMLKIS